MSIFGNQDGDRKKSEQLLEDLKQEIACRDNEIAKLKERIQQLESSQPVPVNSGTPENGAPDGSTAEQSKFEITFPDYTSEFEALKNAISEIKACTDAMRVSVERRETIDENMRSIHKEMERYKADFFAKITQPYLMAMLDLHRRFHETYTYFDHLDNTETDMAELYRKLLKEFKSAIDALANRAYNDFGAEYYEPSSDDRFDPKVMQSMSIISTSNPELHLSISRVLYGGFCNAETGKVIRPARVECYRYVAGEQEQPKQEETANK